MLGDVAGTTVGGARFEDREGSLRVVIPVRGYVSLWLVAGWLFPCAIAIQHRAEVRELLGQLGPIPMLVWVALWVLPGVIATAIASDATRSPRSSACVECRCR